MARKNRVIKIEVLGGVASVVQTYKDIDIEVKDFDNKVKYENRGGQNYPSKPLK